MIVVAVFGSIRKNQFQTPTFTCETRVQRIKSNQKRASICVPARVSVHKHMLNFSRDSVVICGDMMVMSITLKVRRPHTHVHTFIGIEKAKKEDNDEGKPHSFIGNDLHRTAHHMVHESES